MGLILVDREFYPPDLARRDKRAGVDKIKGDNVHRLDSSLAVHILSGVGDGRNRVCDSDEWGPILLGCNAGAAEALGS
jgi:hypothetical protein